MEKIVDRATLRCHHSQMSKLRQYLALEGIRAVALARKAGCSPSLLCHYMQGKKGLSDPMKRRISEATGGKVQPGDLLKLEPEEGVRK